jgi:hypothetical protein
MRQPKTGFVLVKCTATSGSGPEPLPHTRDSNAPGLENTAGALVQPVRPEEGSCYIEVAHQKNIQKFFSPDARWQFMGIRLIKIA